MNQVRFRKTKYVQRADDLAIGTYSPIVLISQAAILGILLRSLLLESFCVTNQKSPYLASVDDPVISVYGLPKSRSFASNSAILFLNSSFSPAAPLALAVFA